MVMMMRRRRRIMMEHHYLFIQCPSLTCVDGDCIFHVLVDPVLGDVHHGSTAS